MGISATRAIAARFTPEAEGYGVIVGHDVIAQAVAEAGTAEAMSRQSRAALSRIERLAGTAGADTVEAHEAAQRQAAADQIAVTLAQRKLSTIFGQRPPWMQGQDGDALVQQIAAGHVKIARVTFPLGAVPSGIPRNLRLARLDAVAVSDQWQTRTVWNAPAAASMPGRSFFALITDRGPEEGERVDAWATRANALEETGAWIPAAAAVVESGRYWYYRQHEEGRYERVLLDVSRPLRDGYFVTDLKAGEAVISTGAGLLLARELNPDTEAD